MIDSKSNVLHSVELNYAGWLESIGLCKAEELKKPFAEIMPYLSKGIDGERKHVWLKWCEKKSDYFELRECTELEVDMNACFELQYMAAISMGEV